MKIPVAFSIYQDGQLLRTETLCQSVIKIGKLSSSHLRLDSKTVSRMHAVIEINDLGDIWIIDLGSTTGTIVNGQKVSKAKLKNDDVLLLGDIRIVLAVGESNANDLGGTPVKRGWIGVDLDGTLAHYDHWRGETHIGAPVPLMAERVKRWLAAGHEVRIFTARVSGPHDEAKAVEIAVKRWCLEHVGVELAVTCTKDYDMLELWDDRAVAVESNTGVAFNPSRRGFC